MQNSDNMRLEAPSLPKGGGAIAGLNGAIGEIGPDGAATFSIPLPVSEGRGYAPELSLSYNSQGGNDAFGIGWTVSVMAISRRTNKGVPHYTDQDEFIGPDNEVMVPVLDILGNAKITKQYSLLGVSFKSVYRVTNYRSRVESQFNCLQYWQAETLIDGEAAEFWVAYCADGQMHLYGYQPLACISDPDNQNHIAHWLINASVSAQGEQIHYGYRREDDKNCPEQEVYSHPNSSAQRYLDKVYYGNKVSERNFRCTKINTFSEKEWLFIQVFDYGERTNSIKEIPTWETLQSWKYRQDAFSSFECGFEVRTRRLCQQVLLFHRTADLESTTPSAALPTLISRLNLIYQQTATITILISARKSAFNDPKDRNSWAALPPVEFNWLQQEQWQNHSWNTLEGAGKLNSIQPYQFLDLWGEGTAGILYQNRGAWWYRAPIRDKNSQDINAITWDKAKPLPSIPVLKKHTLLMDINGDGRLEWVVIHAGANGYYSQDQTQHEKWQSFNLLSGLPTEFHYPNAQLLDLSGKGLSDLVIIGPKTIRLYASDRKGWKTGKIIKQPNDITLPTIASDSRTLVAFGDLLGTGQQHLIKINVDGVYYWPNKGHGKFGHPVNIPGFMPPKGFIPEDIYLADIDGSGTADIIYAHSDYLEIYINQSGNSFAEPVKLRLPAGVRYDYTCNLQFADIQGNGADCMLLTTPLPILRHWLFEFSTKKSRILKQINSNMGMNYTLRYRSSAQLWLDEKAESDNQNTPVCYLPFPVHCLWQVETEDEISGNRLVSQVRYRHGAWDGSEREFRGFGYVETTDTLILKSQGTAPEIAMPKQTRRWFATGIESLDNRFVSEFWRADTQAFRNFAPRFTQGDSEKEIECSAKNKKAAQYWLRRGLKGQLLRSEVYGLDGSTQQSIPYEVIEQRPAIRLIEPKGAYPVIWPTIIESRHYIYERIIEDPQCTQQIILNSDQYGMPLRQVTIHYPRRKAPVINPYRVLNRLPESTWLESYDDQQTKLRINLQRNSYYHFWDLIKHKFQLGVNKSSRQDVLEVNDDFKFKQGFCLEDLLSQNSLIDKNSDFVFAGQQRIAYLDNRGMPTLEALDFPVRVAYTETAEFDDDHIAELRSHYSDPNLANFLHNGGYKQGSYAFPAEREELKRVWVAQRGLTEYGNASQFYKPLRYRETVLSGYSQISWDKYYCVVLAHQDPSGAWSSVDYDWRFLIPKSLIDINGNTYQQTYNGLGQITSQRFSGSKQGQRVGYSDKEFSIPDTIDSALKLSVPLPVSQLFVYATNTWMNKISSDFRTQEYRDITTRLEQQHIITEDGYFSAFAQERVNDDNRCLIKATRDNNYLLLPPHVLHLTTDRYDDDNEQQIQQKIIFHDGLERNLQTSVRVEAGQASLRSDQGVLISQNASNKGNKIPLVTETDFRWAVSGRIEHDNKGQVVRVYQPYFLNDWRYVNDDSARKDKWADTYQYDPLGRVFRVISAKGYQRNTFFTPWFTAQEDENDTLDETSVSLNKLDKEGTML